MRNTTKLLAFILAIFMLASLMIPVSAADITPDAVEGTVGYNAVLVEKKSDEYLDALPSITEYNDTGKEYTISSVDEFLYFDQLITDEGYTGADGLSNWYGALDGITVYLTQDLDFEGERISPVGDYWKARKASNADYYCYLFAGVFDGQGHTIKNVKISPEGNGDGSYSNSDDRKQVMRGYYGLFAGLAPTLSSEAAVKNLILDSTVVFEQCVAIEADNQTFSFDLGGMRTTGAVVGVVTSTDSNDATASDMVGSAVIENVWNKANIEMCGVCGSAGIVAFAKAVKLSIKNCTNSGDLTQVEIDTANRGTQMTQNYPTAGGILGTAGEADSGKDYYMAVSVENCLNEGDISTMQSHTTDSKNTRGPVKIGAIVGTVLAPSGLTRNLTIKNCYNTGTVTLKENETNTTNYKEPKQLDKVPSLGNKDNCNWNVVENNYVDNHTPSDFVAKMNVKYYQMSNTTYTVGEGDAAKACYSLRLIALHSAIDTYENYGYDIEITYVDPTSKETVTVSASVEKLTTVNESIKVTTEDQTTLGTNVTEVTTADLGETNYQYISAVCIDNIPVAYGNITVTVTPNLNDGTVTGTPITFVVTPDYAN